MTFSAVFFIAIGGAFLVEGAVWAVFPRQIRRAYEMVFRGSDKELHVFGLVNVAIGVSMIGAAIKFMAA